LFLYYFLPITLGLYYLAPRPYRNLVLFLASLFFYAWGEPVYILLMLFSTLVDYSHGLLIERYRRRVGWAKAILVSSIVINLGLLGFFKYGDFLIGNVNSLLGAALPPLELPLPIGISFYTFQTMSYTIDVYRNQTPVQRDFIAFAAYVTLFPQLIAGPIVRYRDVARELTKRRETVAAFSQGIQRFAVGLGKKVLLANNIGLLWSEIRAVPAAELSTLAAWLGIIAFGFQIYFDFSGYSDMAIGLGKMFGFNFLENFNYPYMSSSVTEFWRRWHISLGSWFRDYLYIPLGGNKGGWRGGRNLLIVWLVTGFWHGASWNFVLWGLYFGILILLERLFLGPRLKKAPAWLGHLYLLLAVTLGWVLFEFDTFAGGFGYVKIMLGWGNYPFWDSGFPYRLLSNGLLLLAAGLGVTPWPNRVWQWFSAWVQKRQGSFLLPIFFLLLLLAATAYLVDASYNPFLYFRF
jgi:alginate O-acetyltransferase complex protein AlgI